MGSCIIIRMRIKGIPLRIGRIMDKAVSSEVALLGEKAVIESRMGIQNSIHCGKERI